MSEENDYLVVSKEDAEKLNEALGRLYLLKDTEGRGEWPRPGDVTKYYTSPRYSSDSAQAAFGPKDEFLASAAGKTVQLTAGEYTIPADFTALQESWFPRPSGGLPPDQIPPGQNFPPAAAEKKQSGAIDGTIDDK